MSSNHNSGINPTNSLSHPFDLPDHLINPVRSNSFSLESIDKLHHLFELLQPPRIIENEALLRGVVNENFSNTFRLDCAISLLKNIAHLMQYKIDNHV